MTEIATMSKTLKIGASCECLLAHECPWYLHEGRTSARGREAENGVQGEISGAEDHYTGTCHCRRDTIS